MKIVYCIKGTYNSGGMERILANITNYLADILDYEVHVITTEQRGRAPFYTFSEKIKFYDLDIRYWDLPGFSFFKRKILFFYKQIIHRRKLESLLFDIKPAITVSMFDEDAFFLSDIKDNSIKVLATYFSKNVEIDFLRSRGGGFLKTIRARQINRRNARLVRKYARFVTLTREDAGLWGDTGNLEVIPNAISFYPKALPDYSSQSVIAVGRLDPQKGFDMLIEVWKLVALQYPEWKLKIFGSGPFEKDLKQQIKNSDMENHIFMKPAVSQIIDEYLHSSVFILSSRYEGLPMVLLEAMACGLPAVAFTCPCGPKDVIEDGINGYLVEQDNIYHMAEKISIMLNDQDKRKEMGLKAKEIVREYSEEHVMKQWDVLFKKLIKEKTSPDVN